MKKIFIAIVLSFVLIPSVAWGVDNSIDPEFNPICWKEEGCIKIIEQDYAAGSIVDRLPYKKSPHLEGFVHWF